MFALPGASPALLDLAARGTLHGYRKGRLLFEEGDAGETLHIIVSGRLRVFSANPENGREITYGTYGAGEYVGELSLDGGCRSASVEAVEASRCITVTRPTLERFIAERPEFAFELLAKVIRLTRAATLSARQLALNDVYGRLRLLLIDLAAPHADGTRVIDARLTHQDLAHRLGCSRPMVSRQMKDLQRGGIIDRSECPLRIVKPLPARW